VPRKFKDDWIGKLPVRIVILSNELPKLSDFSATIVSRFIILKLTESFYGREDPDLTNKLLPELPGILNWALEGLERLAKRRYFVRPDTAKELIDAFERLPSPVKSFLEERCEVSATASVECNCLYTAWCHWCARNGQLPGTAQNFARALHALIPGL